MYIFKYVNDCVSHGGNQVTLISSFSGGTRKTGDQCPKLKAHDHGHGTTTSMHGVSFCLSAVGSSKLYLLGDRANAVQATC